MVKVTITREAGNLQALVKVIDGNTTREIWMPETEASMLESKTIAEIKALLDDATFTDLGDIV